MTTGNGDNGHYTDAFWPTVDLYRLPGTTIDTKPLPNNAGGEWGEARPPDATWVGGASMADTYGAVGMHLQGILSDLTARKSWFCLDEEIVALGAGITGGGDEHPVETVVENRNLGADGTHALVVDGEAQPVEPGWSATFEQASWTHVEGVGGVVFPTGATLQALREERTGSWSDVHVDGPTDPITRRYLTLWFDHGIQPRGDSYAYVLLPDAGPRQTAGRARRQDTAILANTAEMQAIRARRLGLLAVNFASAGSLEDLTVSAGCSVLLRNGADGSLELAVADPTQELTRLEITLRCSGYRSASAEDTIEVGSLDPIRVTVDTDGAIGATHTVTFHRS